MRTLNDYFIPFSLSTISTAGQVYVPVPDDGKIIKVITALNGTIATADADLTIKTAEGTAGTITVAYSGSAAGDVDSVEPTSNNNVLEGGTIEIETDGASTNAVSIDGTIVIRR
jgi:hypothetical protein